MSDKTGITWTDATWNPITGCSKVSQGCKHCYALRDWPRLAANPKTVYYGRAFTDVAVHAERLDQPLRWNRPRMIFVNSMSDLFHEAVPTEFIDRVFAVMGNAYCMDKGHVFQVLTKRADRMREYLCDTETIYRVTRAMKAMGLDLPGENSPPTWPLPNVWLGVSVENQEAADSRITAVLEAPAAVRWASCEPLLGPVDLSFALGMHHAGGQWREGGGLDWVVVGGESGPKARPMKEAWARSLRDQCAAAGVPYFFKQWGDIEDPANNMVRAGSSAVGWNLLAGAMHEGYPIAVGVRARGALVDGLPKVPVNERSSA
ncbi:MAG: phage Gp37/Gp68 family protein [Burkholderiales bacterium]|nr:phage Gp37/Gp68 family protein [Burkholderiales bacterium]